MSTDSRPSGEHIDLADERSSQAWIDHFGITRSQLEEAVAAAGTLASDVEEHLRNQGASAGAG